MDDGPTAERIVALLAEGDLDIGVRYSETRVTEMLVRWHPDYAALRRYLVDEGFLERDGVGGRYWRSGGSVCE